MFTRYLPLLLLTVFLTINCAGPGDEDNQAQPNTKDSEVVRKDPWIRGDGKIFGPNGGETGYYKVPNGDIYNSADEFSGFSIVAGHIESENGAKTGYIITGSGMLSGCADLTKYPLLRRVFGIWSPLADAKCREKP